MNWLTVLVLTTIRSISYDSKRMSKACDANYARNGNLSNGRMNCAESIYIFFAAGVLARERTD